MSTATETPATETKNAEQKTTSRITDDKFMAAVLGDMGKIVGADGELTAAAPEPVNQTFHNEGFTTMAEVARANAEKKEQKTEEKKEEKKEEKTAEGTAAAKTEEKTTETKTAEAGAGEAKTEEKPKIKVEKAPPLEKLVEGILAKQQEKAAAEKTAAQAAAPKTEEKTDEKADPDADFISTLDRKQKRQIELAQFAAKLDPKKFGAMPKRWVEYLKKLEKFIDAKRAEDPDWTHDNDETFDVFIEDNRPVYEGVDEEDLREQMIEERSVERVEAKLQPKIKEQEDKAFIQEIKPELDAAAEAYRTEIPKRFIIDPKSDLAPVVKIIQEKGMTDEAWNEAKAINPVAVKAIKRETDRGAELGRELFELTSGVTKQIPYNPQLPITHEHNKRALRQQQLYGFIDGQESYFNANGGDAKLKEGKPFLPRRQFFALPEAEQQKYWTISATDVLVMLAIETGARAETAYKTAVKELEEEGYVRKTTTTEAKTETKAEVKEEKKSSEKESPKAKTTASPGAGTGAKVDDGPVLLTEEQLKKMWSGGAASFA